MLTKIGIPVLALFALTVLVSPRPANAEVRFGIAVGGPVYRAPAPVYSYPYSYADPYYAAPAYDYGYVAPAPVYSYPYGYYGGGYNRYDRGYREHEYREHREREYRERDRGHYRR